MPKEKSIAIEDIMESMFDKMYSADIIHQLIQPDITEYERGRVAGMIDMMKKIAMELNPVDELEVQDEDETFGQKLD